MIPVSIKNLRFPVQKQEYKLAFSRLFETLENDFFLILINNKKPPYGGFLLLLLRFYLVFSVPKNLLLNYDSFY